MRVYFVRNNLIYEGLGLETSNIRFCKRFDLTSLLEAELSRPFQNGLNVLKSSHNLGEPFHSSISTFCDLISSRMPG